MPRFFSILVFGALPLLGADLTGIWVGQMPTRNGDHQDLAFQIKQTGTTLAGKIYGDYRSSPLSGTIAGDLVTFVVTTQDQAGNEITQTRVRFTGRIVDGELELFRERESSKNASNAGAVEMKQAPKQPVHLKRLP